MDTDPAQATETIIDLFGGVGPLAAKLDAPFTTVEGWKERGQIPRTRHADIASAAARDNMPLDPAMLAATDPTPIRADGSEIGEDETARDVAAEDVAPEDVAPAIPAPVEAAPPPDDAEPASSFPARSGPAPSSRVESPAVAAAPSRRKGGAAAGLALGVSLLTLIGAGAAGYLAWQEYVEPLNARVAALEARPAADMSANSAVNAQVADLRARIDSLDAKVAETAHVAADLSVADAKRQAQSPQPAQQPTASAKDQAAEDERFAAIEKQIADLKASSAEFAQVAKKMSDLQAAAGSRELLTQSITDIQSSVAANQGEVQRIQAQLAALDGKIDKVDGRIDKTDTALAERKQKSMRAEAVMLAVGELRSALRTDAPYGKEIATVRALAAGDRQILDILDRIQPYADDGVPAIDDLRTDFSHVASNIVRSAVVGDGGSWWRQALYELQSIISVRRVGQSAKGDGADAVVARAEEKLNEDDLQGAIDALRPLKGLPGEVVQPWLHDAEDRLTVNTAEAELTSLSIERVAAGNPEATELQPSGHAQPAQVQGSPEQPAQAPATPSSQAPSGEQP